MNVLVPSCISTFRSINFHRLSLLHFPAENLMTTEIGGCIDCCKEAYFTTSITDDQGNLLAYHFPYVTYGEQCFNWDNDCLL